MATDKVAYWLDIANEDLEVAEDLFKAKRWLYVAFMCHQVIEKTLKAYWNAVREDDPPYVHNHRRLAEGSGLYDKMSDVQRRFLGQISNMNIEARYPEYKTGIARSLNEEKSREIIDETKQMQLWIIREFSPETKPSASSETTSE
ncbi:MAG: HEPN domain-containing protein [Prevotella sp.]|nr:HEPN domain-containing protein [Bacteroidales bacterium]MBR6188038.1 HEPN domain-containing protein [Prevotella sp.]